MPDLLADMRLLQWAGIGFGEQETYRLQKSLKKFAAAKPYKAVRFWGKLLGTEKDYYVIECEGEVEDDGADVDVDPDVEPDPKLEGKGTGVNEFQYWVSQDSLADWSRLPELSYSDLIAAR
jgi:radial spoke head protein 4A